MKSIFSPTANKPLTVKQAKVAAIQAGYLTLSVEALEGCRDLGKYITELGPLYIARARMAFTGDETHKLFKEIDRLMANPDIPPEIAANMLNLKAELIPQMIRVATVEMEASKIDMLRPEAEPKNQIPWEPRQTIAAVKVTINNGGETK